MKIRYKFSRKLYFKLDSNFCYIFYTVYNNTIINQIVIGPFLCVMKGG